MNEEYIGAESSAPTALITVSSALTEAEKYGLTTEVVYFALLHLKENPDASIEESISYGLNEWVK